MKEYEKLSEANSEKVSNCNGLREAVADYEKEKSHLIIRRPEAPFLYFAAFFPVVKVDN